MQKLILHNLESSYKKIKYFKANPLCRKYISGQLQALVCRLGMGILKFGNTIAIKNSHSAIQIKWFLVQW